MHDAGIDIRCPTLMSSFGGCFFSGSRTSTLPEAPGCPISWGSSPRAFGSPRPRPRPPATCSARCVRIQIRNHWFDRHGFPERSVAPSQVICFYAETKLASRLVVCPASRCERFLPVSFSLRVDCCVFFGINSSYLTCGIIGVIMVFGRLLLGEHSTKNKPNQC